jgi:hypothetical protein
MPSANGVGGAMTLPRQFELTPTGLRVSGRPTFQQWEEAGRFLKQAGTSVGFWLGDWLNWGEGAFGEMASQAMDERELTYQTLANYKWVAGKVPPERRRQGLTFEHHRQVARLEPADQERWLAKAAAAPDRWPAAALRRALREQGLAERAAAAASGLPFVIYRGSPAEALGHVGPGTVRLALTAPPAGLRSWGAADVANLARLVARTLAPGGSLLLGCSPHELAEVIGAGSVMLRYWWTVAVACPGGYLDGKGVNAGWRPHVWFVKGGRPDDRAVADHLDEDAAGHLVGRLTAPGETVLDPCCGAGEVLARARELGRVAVGAEADRELLETARNRVAAAVPAPAGG